MVWRIIFSPEDLDRIQLRPTLGPLAETVLAVSLLRCPDQSRTLLKEWRSQVQDRMTLRMRPLVSLIPPGCQGVDLPTLTGETDTIEQGVRALLEVPREHLLVEMAYTNRFNRLSPAAWALAEPGSRPDLADATEAAYRDLVQPYWHRIRASLHAEQAARRRMLAREGAGRLLASLQGPRIRWRAPALEIGMPNHVDMDLAGRGLALVPSMFVGSNPSLHENPNDDDETPRLILPAADMNRSSVWERRRSPGRRWPPWSAGTGPRCWPAWRTAAPPPSWPTGPESRSPRPASTRRCCAARA